MTQESTSTTGEQTAETDTERVTEREDIDWNKDSLRNTLGLRKRQAESVVSAWDSENDLVSDYEDGVALTDYEGIGHATKILLESFIDEHYPNAAALRRKRSEGIATEFGTGGEVNDDGELIWWFTCPRCDHEQECHGDPSGFAGRPYGCRNCGWVAALSSKDMDNVRNVTPDANETTEA